MKKIFGFLISIFFILFVPLFSQNYLVNLDEKMVTDNSGFKSFRRLSSNCEMMFDADNMKVWYIETYRDNSVQYWWNIEAIEKDNDYNNVTYWKVDKKYYPLKYIELNLNGNKVAIGGDIYTVGKSKIVTSNWIQSKLNEIEEKEKQDKIDEEKFQAKRKEFEEIRNKKEIELNKKLPWYGAYYGFNENFSEYYVIYYKIGFTDSVDIETDFNLSFYMNALINSRYSGVKCANNWFFYRKYPPVPKIEWYKCYMLLKDCDATLDAIKYIEEKLKVTNICSYCINEKEKIIDFWNRIGIYFYNKKGEHLRVREVEWDEATYTIIPKSYMKLSEILFGKENTKKEMEKYIKNFFKEKKKNEEN